MPCLVLPNHTQSNLPTFYQAKGMVFHLVVGFVAAVLLIFNEAVFRLSVKRVYGVHTLLLCSKQVEVIRKKNAHTRSPTHTPHMKDIARNKWEKRRLPFLDEERNKD